MEQEKKQPDVRWIRIRCIDGTPLTSVKVFNSTLQRKILVMKGSCGKGFPGF